MPHTYAEFHNERGSLLGTDGVIILDGRWSRDRQIDEARDAAHRRNKAQPWRNITHVRIGRGRFSANNYATGLIAIGERHE